MGKKIALSLGNNTDYEIILNTSVVESLIIDCNIFKNDITNISKISCERDLVISILYFLSTQTGASCFVENIETILNFVKRFEYKETIGGTNPRSAIAMAKLGYESFMHLVTINDSIRTLLPKNCDYVCSNDKDTLYPHLIVQFTANTKISANDIHITTSRANRIMYENDIDNVMLKINREFFDNHLNDAEILLISGLNSILSQDLLWERIRLLKEVLPKCKSHLKIFYEDACFFNYDMSKIVKKELFHFFDIYSLNEDELRQTIDKKLDLLNPLEIIYALEDLYKIATVPLIVIHTKHWALAYGKNATNFAAALKGGITMATTRFRFGDDFTQENYTETENLPAEIEAKIFAEQIQQLVGSCICCLPSVLVNETKVTTIGLGDAFVGGFLPKLLRIAD